MVREVTVQNYVDHFDKTKDCNDFVNFCALWSAQGIISHLREVYLQVYISFIEEEFGEPTGLLQERQRGPRWLRKKVTKL